MKEAVFLVRAVCTPEEREASLLCGDRAPWAGFRQQARSGWVGRLPGVRTAAACRPPAPCGPAAWRRPCYERQDAAEMQPASARPPVHAPRADLHRCRCMAGACTRRTRRCAVLTRCRWLELPGQAARASRCCAEPCLEARGGGSGNEAAEALLLRRLELAWMRLRQ